jgi:hypothetical protein
MKLGIARNFAVALAAGALALPAAADVILYSQPVDPSPANINFGFYSSPQPRARRSFKHADDFTLAAPSEVRSLRWWGINEGLFSNGLANYDLFRIEIFTSQPAPGGPLVATLIHSEVFTVPQTTPINTGRFAPNGQAEMVHFATLASPVTLAANTPYWLAISARAINGSGDAWAWRDGTTALGYSNSFSHATGVWTGFQDTDSAFELIGVPAPAAWPTLLLGTLLASGRRR